MNQGMQVASGSCKGKKIEDVLTSPEYDYSPANVLIWGLLTSRAKS